MLNNKNLVYALGALVVLLAVVAGYLVFANNSGPAVSPIAQTTSPGASTGAPTGGAPTGMPGTAPNADAGPFDPAKATKVPAGTEPKAFAEGYFKAIIAGEYEKAYKMLPTEKQQAQTAQAFGEQLKSYGMKGYKVGKVDATADAATVEVTAETAGGPFTYIWTFAKYNGGWVVKSRALGGMSQ